MVAAGFVSGQPIGRVGCVTTGKTTDGSWHGCHGTLGGVGGNSFFTEVQMEEEGFGVFISSKMASF